MLIRRLHYLLRQNTEEGGLRVIAGTDAPTEVSEPVEDDGKNLAIVSEEPGIPSSVDTQRTPPEGDAGTEGEVPGSTAVTLCLGQHAMSYAMRCPEPGKRGVRNPELLALAESLGIKKRSLNDRVYKARLVLHYNEEAVPLVMSGALSLWKAYDQALDLKGRKDREVPKDPRHNSQLRPMARVHEEEIAEAA